MVRGQGDVQHLRHVEIVVPIINVHGILLFLFPDVGLRLGRDCIMILNLRHLDKATQQVLDWLAVKMEVQTLESALQVLEKKSGDNETTSIMELNKSDPGCQED